MPSIHLAWNPKHLIVQWVGIGTHTHFLTVPRCGMSSSVPAFRLRDPGSIPAGSGILISVLILGAKGDWDFQISDLVKNPDGTDI